MDKDKTVLKNYVLFLYLIVVVLIYSKIYSKKLLKNRLLGSYSNYQIKIINFK